MTSFLLTSVTSLRLFMSKLKSALLLHSKKLMLQQAWEWGPICDDVGTTRAPAVRACVKTSPTKPGDQREAWKSDLEQCALNFTYRQWIFGALTCQHGVIYNMKALQNRILKILQNFALFFCFSVGFFALYRELLYSNFVVLC